MNKAVFVFDLNMLLPEEREEELRAKLAAQIESGVLLLGDEVTFVEAFGAPEKNTVSTGSTFSVLYRAVSTAAYCVSLGSAVHRYGAGENCHTSPYF